MSRSGRERAPTVNGRPRLSWPAGHHQTARAAVQTSYAGDSQLLCSWSTACQPVCLRRSGGDRRRPVAGDIRHDTVEFSRYEDEAVYRSLAGAIRCGGDLLLPRFASRAGIRTILPPAGRVSGPTTRRWPPAARVSRPRPGRSGMPASALGLAAAHRRQPDHGEGEERLAGLALAQDRVGGEVAVDGDLVHRRSPSGCLPVGGTRQRLSRAGRGPAGTAGVPVSPGRCGTAVGAERSEGSPTRPACAGFIGAVPRRGSADLRATHRLPCAMSGRT